MKKRMVYKDVGHKHKFEKLALVHRHYPKAEWGPYSSFYVDGIMVATMVKDDTQYNIYVFPMAVIKPATISLMVLKCR